MRKRPFVQSRSRIRQNWQTELHYQEILVMVCSQQCVWDGQAKEVHYESLLMADYYPV
jgi:hypothetical protein